MTDTKAPEKIAHRFRVMAHTLKQQYDHQEVRSGMLAAALELILADGGPDATVNWLLAIASDIDRAAHPKGNQLQ